MEDLIKTLEYMEKAVNYNNWLFNDFNKYIGRRVLDVGGGLGVHTQRLIGREKVITVEIIPELTAYLKNKFKDKGVTVIQGDICDRSLVADIKPQNIDTILCLNVLEHIRDDKLALQNMFDCLAPGGHLILFVPAIQFLFGITDIAQNHFRRYNKNRLEAMLKNTGFSIVDSYYVNMVGALAWFLHSKVLKKRLIPAKNILLYDKLLVPIISIFENIIHPPFGQSLLMVCRKGISK